MIEFRIPRITSQTYPAWIPAAKTNTFATNPANGGMPARDRKAANIISASVHSTPDRKGINIFEVDVQNLDHLNRVINALLKVKGVYKVERMRN